MIIPPARGRDRYPQRLRESAGRGHKNGLFQRIHREESCAGAAVCPYPLRASPHLSNGEPFSPDRSRRKFPFATPSARQGSPCLTKPRVSRLVSSDGLAYSSSPAPLISR